MGRSLTIRTNLGLDRDREDLRLHPRLLDRRLHPRLLNRRLRPLRLRLRLRRSLLNLPLRLNRRLRPLHLRRSLLNLRLPLHLNLRLRLADPGNQAGLNLRPVDLRLAVLAGITGRVDPGNQAGLNLRPVDLRLAVLAEITGRVDLAVLVGRPDLDPEGLVGRELPGLTGRVALVDRRHLRTGPRVPTIGVTPNWAAPLTRRTASAHPTMARRLRPRNAGLAGMADPLPEGLRLTGLGRRPRVAGMVRRLPVVGTLGGTGRRAT